MNKEIEELLNEILDWMGENDYECGEWGSQIYDKITKILENTKIN